MTVKGVDAGTKVSPSAYNAIALNRGKEGSIDAGVKKAHPLIDTLISAERSDHTYSNPSGKVIFKLGSRSENSLVKWKVYVAVAHSV